MRKILHVIFFLFLLSANTYADTLAAIERFEGCLKAAASTLDDFMSPASDIAAAAVAQCRPAWQSVLLNNNESLTKMDGYPSRDVQDAALRSVLNARREAAAKRSNVPPPPAPSHEVKKPGRMM